MLSNPNAPMSMRLFPISPERKGDKKRRSMLMLMLMYAV